VQSLTDVPVAVRHTDLRCDRGWFQGAPHCTKEMLIVKPANTSGSVARHMTCAGSCETFEIDHMDLEVREMSTCRISSVGEGTSLICSSVPALVAKNELRWRTGLHRGHMLGAQSAPVTLLSRLILPKLGRRAINRIIAACRPKRHINAMTVARN